MEQRKLETTPATKMDYYGFPSGKGKPREVIVHIDIDREVMENDLERVHESWDEFCAGTEVVQARNLLLSYLDEKGKLTDHVHGVNARNAYLKLVQEWMKGKGVGLMVFAGWDAKEKKWDDFRFGFATKSGTKEHIKRIDWWYGGFFDRGFIRKETEEIRDNRLV